MEDVAKAPKIEAKLLAEVVEESHAWAVAHGLVMGLPGGTAFVHEQSKFRDPCRPSSISFNLLQEMLARWCTHR